MIELKKIKPETFSDFKKQAIKDFAEQSAKSGYINKNKSLAFSKKELKNLLPDKLETANNFIEKIIYKQEPVGYLWYVLEKKEKTAFIYYIFISDKFRGKKLGQETIKEFAKKLKKQKIKNIELHVFVKNKSAISLYEKSGFKTTGIFMKKKI
jgi:ribosomal protein S18 acetylase RimI-like enzyme